MPNILEKMDVASDPVMEWVHCEKVDSSFRLVIVASLRSKQLTRGASPRIKADPKKRRWTSIALEETKQGRVPFMIGEETK